MGGMLDECKSDIYARISPEYLPQYRVISHATQTRIIESADHFCFPIILKPDIGFRGYKVKRISSLEMLEQVSTEYEGITLLMQEYLDYPEEFSVLYYNIKGKGYGISSITQKILPQVIGDGVSSLAELIKNVNNPFLDKDWVMTNMSSVLDHVPELNQSVPVDHIGNYARGSSFKNITDRVNSELIGNIHSFFSSITEMYFCRADIKAENYASLCRGEFKILEINGAKSEPIHIYDDKMSWMKVIRTTHQHWSLLFQVVKSRLSSPEQMPSSYEGIKSYKHLKKLVH